MYRNIVNFSRTIRIHFCFKNTLKNAIQTDGEKKPQNLLFPLGHVDPHVIHQCLGPPNSPPQTASRSNQPIFHSSTTGPRDRRTDRPTDGRGDKPVRIPAVPHTLFCIDRDRRG